MAQGVAWAARELGVPCTVIAPDHAPQTKVDAIERLGGRVIKEPFDRWWNVIVESRYEGVDGLFLHPVENEDVMAGNGTIGIEILEDLPDVDAVLIPWGGGGLTVGIASAIKAKRPEAKIFAVEQETAAPLNATLAAGRRRRSSTSTRSSTEPARGRSYRRCGRSVSRCSTAPTRCRWTRRRRRSGCWPSGCE